MLRLKTNFDESEFSKIILQRQSNFYDVYNISKVLQMRRIYSNNRQSFRYSTRVALGQKKDHTGTRRTKKYRRRPSLFLDSLSANSLIHNSKSVKNDNYLVKNGLFICTFRIRQSNMTELSIGNNEGNLYQALFDLLTCSETIDAKSLKIVFSSEID